MTTQQPAFPLLSPVAFLVTSLALPLTLRLLAHLILLRRQESLDLQTVPLASLQAFPMAHSALLQDQGRLTPLLLVELLVALPTHQSQRAIPTLLKLPQMEPPTQAQLSHITPPTHRNHQKRPSLLLATQLLTLSKAKTLQHKPAQLPVQILPQLEPKHELLALISLPLLVQETLFQTTRVL